MEGSIIEHQKGHTKPIILVTGGNGFLGSHVAKFYHEQGYRVRIVDNVAQSILFPHNFFSERVIGNLCDINVCRHAVRGAVVVLHFAALTGGAGMTDSRNDHTIYRTNRVITQNLLEVSLAEGVHTFFLASSAAVYPSRPQASLSDVNVPLKEDVVYGDSGERPEPQGGYGLEKLHAEELLFQYTDRLKIRVGRFHSIYGPGNVWSGGRERALAALLRKALALRFAGEQPSQFEVWGDGSRRRGFLYIDDAVKAVVALVDATGPRPALNIGHSESTSISELAELSLEAVGLDPSSVDLIFRTDKPVGVANRSSDNSLIEHELGWRPEIDLREGLKRTGDWMSEQMQQALANPDHATQHDILGSFMKSEVVDLASLSIKFAVLIPITSRGASPETCIRNLRSFARSLHETTWRDRTELGTTPYEVRIYLAIDEDDHYLRPTSDDEEGRAEGVLREYGFSSITTLYCNHPPGHVCALWRDCARRAFDEKCDYYVLMGDDIVLLDEGWMRTINTKFAEIATSSGGPHGFGCVAFTDRSFPGMPTFPVVHRTHMEIFEGEVVPEAFINQDGDPYLFQIYRHFGASTTVASRLRNSIGGSDDARYQKESLTGWTFETLENGKQAVAKWAKKYAPAIRQMVSIDIIVPSYRVDLSILKRILHLQPSPTCTTMFIIIIDNPHSPELYELLHTYSHRMDVRIRVNKSNMGASATRNRGLSESSAEWVIFLDDDVIPVTEFLVEVEKAVHAHPDAAGFVGNTYFPVAPNIYTTGVHLAGMTHFWNIADKLKEDIPWGITANLVVRRNIRDGIEFRLSFPKTGGGEDIDFCRRKREASLKRGGTAFWAAPKAVVVHPWWNEGRRSYRRFFMWAYGDGALIKMYPELAWRDWTPNSAELLLFASFLGVSGLGLGLCRRARAPVIAGSALFLSTMISNIFHDTLRHHITDRRRAVEFNTSVGRIGWTCAAMEGGLIRMTSEMGRLVGLLQRGEWFYIGARFDWYAGRSNAIHEEWSNGLQRFGLVAALSVVMFRCWYK